jgi:hypothetical protein
MKVSFTKRFEKDEETGKRYPIMMANVEFSMEELDKLRDGDDRLSRTISKSLLRLFNEMEFSGDVTEDDDIDINIQK